MRRRLTACFVLLALLLLLLAGVVRAFAIRDLINDQERAHLHHDVRVMALRIDDRIAAGDAIDQTFLEGLVSADSQVVFEGNGATVVANGAGYHPAEGGNSIEASADTSQGRLTVHQSSDVIGDALGRSLGSLIVLMALLCVIAGTLGLIAATLLARPFQKLAAAAAALGRGRFDLDLPKSRIPEVTAIGDALLLSAAQLKHSISSDREFLQHASHVLRTPIAGVRLELEELAGKPGLGEDVRGSVLHSAAEMERLNGVIDTLLADSRKRPLVAGAEIDLRSLATQIGQRWREGVPEDTSVRVFVDDGADDRITPGPVEQLFDHLLADVIALDPREVALRFSGQGNYLRIRVTGQHSASTGGDAQALVRALSVSDAMGGRINGDLMAERGLEILLPRR
ncbi:MAG: HAMP domain-containing sensor histidine kinase [Nocardioides sp.]